MTETSMREAWEEMRGGERDWECTRVKDGKSAEKKQTDIIKM